MTDQELLEFAAKAAGLNVKAQSVNADDRWLGLVIGEKHTREKKFWNPLTDDGDALRLAVKLGLFVDIYDTEVLAGWVVDKDSSSMETLNQPKGNDPYAATRRAIVRAAAELGKNMEVTK